MSNEDRRNQRITNLTDEEAAWLDREALREQGSKSEVLRRCVQGAMSRQVEELAK